METRKIKTPSFLRKKSPKSVPLNSLRSLGSIKPDTIPTASTATKKSSLSNLSSLPRSKYQISSNSIISRGQTSLPKSLSKSNSQVSSRVYSPVAVSPMSDSSSDSSDLFDKSIQPQFNTSIKQSTMIQSPPKPQSPQFIKPKTPTPQPPQFTKPKTPTPTPPQPQPQPQEPDLLTRTSKGVLSQLQQGTTTLTQNVRSVVEKNNPPNAGQIAPIDHLAHHFKNFVVRPGRRQLRGVVGRTKNLLGNLENALTSASIGGRKLRKTRKTRKNKHTARKTKKVHQRKSRKKHKKQKNNRKSRKSRKSRKMRMRKSRKH